MAGKAFVAGHAFHIQILDTYDRVIENQTSRELVESVRANVCYLCVKSCQFFTSPCGDWQNLSSFEIASGTVSAFG